MSHYATKTSTGKVIHIPLPTTVAQLQLALQSEGVEGGDQVLLQSFRSGMLIIEVGKGARNRRPIIDSIPLEE